MQTVTTKVIMPMVTLTCAGTDKFKTGFITVNIITRLDKKTAARNALLPQVLRRGTSAHRDMRALSDALDELYGARLEPLNRKIGEYQCVGMYADFVDDDFLPGDKRILEKMISLLGEALLSPLTHGGLLFSEYVESEKEKLIAQIRSEINDKRRYALTRMFELMCSEEAYGVNKNGSEASVAQITNQSLTKHYRKLISESPIEIIYCGAAPFERVAAAVLDSFSALPRSELSAPAPADIIFAPKSASVREITEEFDVTQGKLTLGFRVGSAMASPNYPALMLFNELYGGSVTSKLFTNVRERLSLCYYASSVLDRHKGVMAVYSGVDFKNFATAKDEILRQLDDIRSGVISDDELTSVKRSYVTSVRMSQDSPFGIESTYLAMRLSEMPVSPEDMASLAMMVTADDISVIARGVKLDTVYYLTGRGANVDEA